MILGFKLSHIITPSNIDDMEFAEGMLEYMPKVDYRLKQPDPVKPWLTWKQGKYHVDEFSCVIPVTPEEYYDVLNFLNTVEMADLETGFGLFLSYYQDDDQIVFPITGISKLPQSTQELQIMPDVIRFTLESKYQLNPGMPAFVAYSAGNYGDDLYNW